tara:strand:- start:412 stop:1665 length:1254 start_codon:yes stop_codon:yes gene_type:complete
MKNYNQLEKRISNFLKLNPKLHSYVKLTYQRLSFFLNHEKNFKLSIDKDCIITDLEVSNSFFGYFDHTPWSDNMKYFILHVIDKNKIKLNLYSFKKSKIFFEKELTNSKFYNFQQGIRPIWIDENRIVFNRFINDKLIASIYNAQDKTFTDLNFPIQEMSSKNNLLISMDYYKLDYINKDYGYGIQGKAIKNEINGIVGYNFIQDKTVFKLSSNDIHAISKNRNLPLTKCEINHVHHSPYDNSFVFIYRNKSHNGFSELYHYDYKVNALKVIYSGSLMSHYCWIDKNIIFAYLEHNGKTGFFEINYNDSISITQNILPDPKDNLSDGHPSVSPNNRWIVFDTYPDKSRQSHLYIIRNNSVNKSQKILIGKFYSPLKFNGYNRCDLHPRWSPDGNYISIDSAHRGERKTYLIDISKII